MSVEGDDKRREIELVVREEEDEEEDGTKEVDIMANPELGRCVKDCSFFFMGF